VVAAAIRWYGAVGRLEGVPACSPRQDLRQVKERLRNRIVQLVADDQDMPSLRYILHYLDRLYDEEQVARAYGKNDYAARVAGIQAAILHVAEQFSLHGERRLCTMWPYLYTTGADGRLVERLHFVLGRPTTVNLRVNNYSRKARKVTVSLRLPEGWTSTPVTLTTTPGEHAEAKMTISCPPNARSKVVISAVLTTPGLPERVVNLDDIAVESPVEVGVAPVQGLLPETPVRLTLTNPGNEPVSGTLKIRPADSDRVLATVPFTNLVNAKPTSVDVRLDSANPPPFNEWRLIQNTKLEDGRTVEKPLGIDFACAVRATSPVTIDGDLSEWSKATPLHLDKEGYTKGTFGAGWTPEDLSGTVYCMWDDNYMYVACKVVDQVFYQMMTNSGVWQQDSVQLGFARDENSERSEFNYAHTPMGDRVYADNAEITYGLADECRLKVDVHNGGATYELAIPWHYVSGIGRPVPGETIRFAVLFNDDDGLTGRRFIERYSGIAHSRNVGDFGYLKLLP
jgi:hypothetical protein